MNKLMGSTKKFIIYFFNLNRLNFSFMLFSISIYSICHASLPYFVGTLVDEVSFNPANNIYYPISMILSLWLFMEIATRSYGILSIRTFPFCRSKSRKMIYDQLKLYSQDFFNGHFSGSISSKIIETSKSSERIMEILIISFLSPFIYLLIYSFILFKIIPILLIPIFFLIIAQIGITIKISGSTIKSVDDFNSAYSSVGGYLVDYISNIFTVKTYERFAYENNLFIKKQDEEVYHYKKFLSISERMNLFKSGISFIFIFFISLVAVYMHNRNYISPGELSVLFMASISLTSLSWRTSQEVIKLFLEWGTVKANLEFFNKETKDYRERNSSFPLLIKKGKISFQHVSFYYFLGIPIFEDLNLIIFPGEKIGIKGPSGIGKSTFIKLMLQINIPQKGRILIDEQNISYVSLSSLREQITFIPQDISLFHRSIFDNIIYGRPTASFKEVIEASKIARCHEFIIKLPEKYNSIVGERGIKLSGGQKQRIAIARAILKNSPIWLIDEATSALDSENEGYIHNSMNSLFKDKTIITVSHRDSTLFHMDRLLEVKQGKIIEINKT